MLDEFSEGLVVVGENSELNLFDSSIPVDQLVDTIADTLSGHFEERAEGYITLRNESESYSKIIINSTLGKVGIGRLNDTSNRQTRRAHAASEKKADTTISRALVIEARLGVRDFEISSMDDVTGVDACLMRLNNGNPLWGELRSNFMRLTEGAVLVEEAEKEMWNMLTSGISDYSSLETLINVIDYEVSTGDGSLTPLLELLATDLHDSESEEKFLKLIRDSSLGDQNLEAKVLDALVKTDESITQWIELIMRDRTGNPVDFLLENKQFWPDMLTQKLQTGVSLNINGLINDMKRKLTPFIRQNQLLPSLTRGLAGTEARFMMGRAKKVSNTSSTHTDKSDETEQYKQHAKRANRKQKSGRRYTPSSSTKVDSFIVENEENKILRLKLNTHRGAIWTPKDEVDEVVADFLHAYPGDQELTNDVDRILLELQRNPMGKGTKPIVGARKIISDGRQMRVRRFNPGFTPDLPLSTLISRDVRVVYCLKPTPSKAFDIGVLALLRHDDYDRFLRKVS